MLMPPTNAVRPSMTVILRWSRWLISHSPCVGERVDGVELERVHALRGQVGEELARRLEAADAVVDQVHRDASRRGRGELLRELLADLVGLEDVGLHVDGRGRGRQRTVHRLVGRRRPSCSSVTLLPAGQRRAGDLLLVGEMAAEDVGVLALRLHACEHALARRLPTAGRAHLRCAPRCGCRGPRRSAAPSAARCRR